MGDSAGNGSGRAICNFRDAAWGYGEFRCIPEPDIHIWESRWADEGRHRLLPHPRRDLATTAGDDLALDTNKRLRDGIERERWRSPLQQCGEYTLPSQSHLTGSI